MPTSHPLTDAHPFARRTHLRPVPVRILWSGHRAQDGDRVLLRHQRPRGAWAGYPSGMCPPDVAKSLKKLEQDMRSRGHDPFACNCIGRDPEQDAEFRGAGGRAAHMPGAWREDAVGWHLGGRAIDVTLPGDYRDAPTPERLRMHADLTEIGQSLGWVGIAEVGHYDDWHFEHHGPWSALVEALGGRQGALGALLDVGGWRGPRWEWRAVQAQLWRIGIDVGGLDGWPGSNTYAGLEAAMLPRDSDPSILLPALYEMAPPSNLA